MNTNKDYNSVKFIATRFSLPLFMVSRNRLKYERHKELKRHLEKNVNLYDNNVEKEFESKTLSHAEHILGMEKSIITCNVSPSSLTEKEIKTKAKGWQLPPNRYDTQKIPFINTRGLGGAYWAKEHTHQAKSRPNTRQPQFRFYDLPRATEKMSTSCHRTSGIFLSNARDRPATSRCMVSNILSCYKSPTEPGPTTYSPNYQSSAVSKRIIKLNPHLFYRYSIVPIKRNSIHTPHTSFRAAPGRYDIRYGRTCPCSSKLIYKPEIDLLIEKEKRNKFRRLPYKKILRKFFASPDWRHVKGAGFSHLFKGAEKPAARVASLDQEVKKQKELKLYPDSKYISMITKPVRTALSLRKEPVLNLPPRVKYNCIAKVIMRKQLKNNKKIAFNSGQERFRDSYRLPVLTQKQQEIIKNSLPLERQFRDHPILTKRPSEIESKIFFTPQHMLPHFVPKLRKKLFKFLPLPEAKILVNEFDTHAVAVDKDGNFFQYLDPKKFFKENT